MSSRIYAAGNRATAVANIVADSAAWFITDQGRKVLDMSKVLAYLSEKFRTLATDEGLAAGGTADAAARSVGVTALANDLEAKIGLSALSQRSGYPLNVDQASIAAAVAAARAKTDARAAELTASFAFVQTDALVDFARTFYLESGIDSVLPAGDPLIFNTRTYRCVYRTDKGELSKPSDASPLITIDQNDTVNLTAPAPPAGRFVNDVLWYRSQNSSGVASFQYVGEKPVGAGLTFTDNKIAEELGEVLPSTLWDEPPVNLRSLRMHPGNFGVGFFDNTVCFSVANRLYAWPIAWRKTTLRPIVGIEVGGTTVFVGTRGEPVLVTGSDPAFMSAERIKGGEPCRSARSIVATHRGFMYAGASGIAVCNSVDDTPVLTRELFTRQQWEALNPESIVAIEHDGCYIFLWNNGASSGCYSYGIDTGRLSTLELAASALFKNPANGRLYAVSGVQIVEVFGAAEARLGLWRSPRVRAAGRGGFAWRVVTSDYEAGAMTVRWNRWFEHQDGTVTSDVKTYAAGNRVPDRVHSGKPSEYEIELEGRSAVSELRMCSTSAELQQ